MAQNAMQLYQVTPGVHWLEVPEFDLRILCGCPAEVVKHLTRRGFIRQELRGGREIESGPNAILLSELPIQSGTLANLSEFPVLQMLYRQGMLIPGHPNYGRRPLLIGTPTKIRRQLDYIHRGNYGLLDLQELLDAGVEAGLAQEMMSVKLAFAFGEIRAPQDYIDTLSVEQEPVTLRPGLSVRRLGTNRFEFRLRDDRQMVDLNLPEGSTYELPYSLQHHEVSRAYFSIIHTGEGDGWDINRPSMSSVLMFQGRCFLVDAPPNIEQTLSHLGIDLSEVEGIFHTHAHDDHFAGLATLMRTGQRVRYYATRLVRHSVTKKLSALTGMDERRFAQFFTIRDLDFDRWNECDGLEVKPIYSPHPVENNLFLFRALGADGYRSYGHWADLTALPVLEKMASNSHRHPPISEAFLKRIKVDYQTPADIKKLDIGGGAIHGRAEDFAGDASGRLVLAHIARPLTDAEREIGSSATFGAEDILIPSERDYRRQRALRYLRTYLPKSPDYRIEALLNAPLMEFNAGAIVLRRGSRPEHLYLLLTGTLEFIQSENALRTLYATGALIGEQALFDNTPLPGSWRAVSHAALLRLPLHMVSRTLESEGMLERVREQVKRIAQLRRSRLFGERIGHATLRQMADHCHTFSLAPGEVAPAPARNALNLVVSGALELLAPDGRPLELLGAGDYCGEEGTFDALPHSFAARALEAVEMVRIDGFPLTQIPVVLWKLLEARARRQNLLLPHCSTD